MMQSNKGWTNLARQPGWFSIPFLLVLPLAVAAQQARPNPFAPPLAKVQYAPDRDYDLQHVALDLDVDYAKRAFRGVVVNTLAPLRDGLTTIRLHCGANLNVDACELSGQGARFTREGDILYAATEHGTDVTADGTGVVDAQRTYQLVRRVGQVSESLFEIEFLDAGVEVYCFTFG